MCACSALMGVLLRELGGGFGKGDGQLSRPVGLALTLRGTVLVSERGNHCGERAESERRRLCAQVGARMEGREEEREAERESSMDHVVLL